MTIEEIVPLINTAIDEAINVWADDQIPYKRAADARNALETAIRQLVKERDAWKQRAEEAERYYDPINKRAIIPEGPFGSDR